MKLYRATKAIGFSIILEILKNITALIKAPMAYNQPNDNSHNSKPQYRIACQSSIPNPPEATIRIPTRAPRTLIFLAMLSSVTPQRINPKKNNKGNRKKAYTA
jgi:hypothetical protein